MALKSILFQNVNASGDPMYNEYRGMQRQYVKDKEARICLY